MKIFRKIALTMLLAFALPICVCAQETFHAAYLHGFPDGTIRPDEIVTRAELAQILYRMMDERAKQDAQHAECSFPDLSPSHWSYEAISALVYDRIMLGGSDGLFRPEDGVTAEELSILFERIRASETGVEVLPELAAGWAEQRVTFADGNGWVMGLHNGVFSKDQPFTRAELAALFNRILGRTPAALTDLLVGMPLFSDNLDTRTSYFLDIQEASVDHTAEALAGQERWTGLG